MEPALDHLLAQALAEDIGPGDVTTASTISEDARCMARLVAKQDGVLSGMEVFRRVFELAGAQPGRWSALSDGGRFSAGERLAQFHGLTRGILTGERVALNFVQRLTGAATLTSEFVSAVSGLPARICDTRKTTPLLRRLEKAAVRHGGGVNHRFALFDGVLIKENHAAGAGGLGAAIARARAGAHHLLRIQAEVRNLDELDAALNAGVDAVLLDNMDIETLKQGVERAHAAGVTVEASGNVELSTVRQIAETGVDLISVGALTHSAPAADLSLLVEPDPDSAAAGVQAVEGP